jgi:hypothetical protein
VAAANATVRGAIEKLQIAESPPQPRRAVITPPIRR